MRGHWTVWVMDSNGDGQHCLHTGAGGDSPPSWSPDSNALVFTTLIGSLFGRINETHHIVDLTGKLLTPGPGVNRLSSGRLFFHPNGRQMLWLATDRRLFSIDKDGVLVRLCQLGDDWSVDRDWSRAVFTHRIEDSYSVMAVDIASGSVRNLSSGLGPKISPDGKLVIFYQRHELPRAICVIDFEGQHVKPAVHFTGTERPVDFCWLADGKNIVFSCESSMPEIMGSYECSIRIVNLDGTGMRQLVNDKETYRDLHSSPDGTAIVFYGGPRMSRGLYIVSTTDGTWKRLSPMRKIETTD